MAHENSVSFKCYLQGENLNEVRRFGVDKDVVSNFGYLVGKLQTVFPSLHGRNFSIAWKDSDGDEVVISSDDELMIALTEQQTDVRKLYIKLKPGCAQEEHDGEGRQQHVGVTCDGCNKGVEGFRYKCIQCPDFDLCAVCEGKGLHSQHYMIRMPVPTSWRPHFGKRLAHHLSKAAFKASRMDGDGYCPYGAFGEGKGTDCGFRHGHHKGGKHYKDRHHVGWLDTLASYLNEWSLPDDDEVIENKDAGAGPSNRKQSKTCQKDDAHVQYLKNIGKTVANLLDPLGIDVDVEVRTKDKSEDGDGKQKGTEEQVSAMEVDDKQDKDKELQEKRDQSPESEGWTILSPQQTDQIQKQTETSAAASGAATASATASVAATTSAEPSIMTTATTTAPVNSGAVPKQMSAITTGNNMYPNLFTPPVMTQPPLISPSFQAVPAFVSAMHTPIVHPAHFVHPSMQAPISSAPEPMQHAAGVRPHVAEAVEKMMSMGFSNDGGWLTQLLDSKDGDIIKALDVLQPVKRS